MVRVIKHSAAAAAAAAATTPLPPSPTPPPPPPPPPAQTAPQTTSEKNEPPAYEQTLPNTNTETNTTNPEVEVEVEVEAEAEAEAASWETIPTSRPRTAIAHDNDNNNDDEDDGVEVVFTHVCGPDQGARVYISGSIPQLGSWKVTAAAAMAVSDYGGDGRLRWMATLRLPVGSLLEYKFIEKIPRAPNFLDRLWGWAACPSGGSVRWESGANRRYTVRPGGCNWVSSGK